MLTLLFWCFVCVCDVEAKQTLCLSPIFPSTRFGARPMLPGMWIAMLHRTRMGTWNTISYWTWYARGILLWSYNHNEMRLTWWFLRGNPGNILARTGWFPKYKKKSSGFPFILDKSRHFNQTRPFKPRVFVNVFLILPLMTRFNIRIITFFQHIAKPGFCVVFLPSCLVCCI